MHVAVDEAGHQRALAAIDDVGLADLDRLRGHFLDLRALDEKLVATLQLAGLRIEHLEVLEVDERHGGYLRVWNRLIPLVRNSLALVNAS